MDKNKKVFPKSDRITFIDEKLCNVMQIHNR